MGVSLSGYQRRRLRDCVPGEIQDRGEMAPNRSVWCVHLVFQNDQRQRRKDEVAAGTTWPLKHFTKLESDEVCAYFFIPHLSV